MMTPFLTFIHSVQTSFLIITFNVFEVINSHTNGYKASKYTQTTNSLLSATKSMVVREIHGIQTQTMMDF